MICVHVPTQKDSTDVQKALFKLYYNWLDPSNGPISYPTEEYGKDAVIFIEPEISCDSLEWAHKMSYTIITTESFFNEVLPKLTPLPIEERR